MRSNVIKSGLIAAFAVVCLGPVSQPSQAQGGCDGTNFFSGPGGPGAMPGFGQGRRGRGDRMRQMAGDNIPNWRQIRTLPSLSPTQRQELQQVFEGSRAEMQPLMQQLRDLCAGSGGPCAGKFGRTGAPGGFGGGVQALSKPGERVQAVLPNGSAVTPETIPFDEAQIGQGPGAGGEDGPRGQRGAGMRGLMTNPQTRQKAFAIRQQMQSKRQALWQQVQAILTPQQLQDLERMKRGELVPASLTGDMTGAPPNAVAPIGDFNQIPGFRGRRGRFGGGFPNFASEADGMQRPPGGSFGQ